MDDQTGLRPYIAELAALEQQIEAVLHRLVDAVSVHPDAAVAVRHFQEVVGSQRKTLQARLEAIEGIASVPARSFGTPPFPTTERSGDEARTVSAALHEIYAAFAYAAFGCAMLHARAHRFFDRTTADLVEQHLRNYAEAAHTIHRLISDAVVWELGKQGQECQCMCPSCGLGICVCAPHGTLTVAEAWGEPTPAAAEGGMLVRPPRANSPTARAGLRAGDMIVAVDDQEIHSVDDLQLLIRQHSPGEEIRLHVRQPSGDLLDLVVARPKPPAAL